MLNLSPIFEDSLDSLENGSDALEINSLPTTVFLMQKDVINHYRHAISHYFNLTLHEPCLQNSSLGTPYQKWRKFTNDNFALLSFSIKVLATFSSRLFHRSALRQRAKDGQYATMKADSNRYIALVSHLRRSGQPVGIVINEDETLDVNSLKMNSMLENWTECPIETARMDISNRAVLRIIWRRAADEIALLEAIHASYTEKCRKFCHDTDAFAEFKSLHEAYWI